MELHNNNGITYKVLGFIEGADPRSNVYFLRSESGKKYVVAEGWNAEKCYWTEGAYFDVWSGCPDEEARAKARVYFFEIAKEAQL